MKYYIYISDAKVDMLLPQISDEKKKKVATEFKFDVKLLGISRKAETEIVENRITRLNTVINYINEYGNVGSINHPDAYILDSLPMTMFVVRQTSAVYFTGTTKDTIVGLHGSSSHILGNPPSNNIDKYIDPSSAFWFIHQLNMMVKEGVENEGMPADKKISILYQAQRLAEISKGPKIQLEFMAKRFISETGDEEDGIGKVIIGSPLYVAMSEVPNGL